MQSFILNHALSNAYHLLSRSGLPLNQPLEMGIRSTLSSNTVLGNPGAANRAEAGLLPVLWTTLKKLCSLYMYVACACVCAYTAQIQLMTITITIYLENWLVQFLYFKRNGINNHLCMFSVGCRRFHSNAFVFVFTIFLSDLSSTNPSEVKT